MHMVNILSPLGTNANAVGVNSIAIGHDAYASTANQIVIGSSSSEVVYWWYPKIRIPIHNLMLLQLDAYRAAPYSIPIGTSIVRIPIYPKDFMGGSDNDGSYWTISSY